MAKWANQVKLTWLKGMEALGTTASNLASNAKHKVAEINLETRRREILTEFSIQAFDLWQKGEKLPEPLEALLMEMSELDERLSVLRAQRYAKVDGSDAPESPAEAEADDTGAESAESGDPAAEAQTEAAMPAQEQAEEPDRQEGEDQPLDTAE